MGVQTAPCELQSIFPGPPFQTASSQPVHVNSVLSRSFACKGLVARMVAAPTCPAVCMHVQLAQSRRCAAGSTVTACRPRPPLGPSSLPPLAWLHPFPLIPASYRAFQWLQGPNRAKQPIFPRQRRETAAGLGSMPGSSVDDEAATSARLWREARRSIAVGVAGLLVCAAGLACFVMSMPRLQVRTVQLGSTSGRASGGPGAAAATARRREAARAAAARVAPVAASRSAARHGRSCQCGTKHAARAAP